MHQALTFPLVDMQAAANAGNHWVALTLRIDADPADGSEAAAWHAVFASGDLLSAVAPLDCVVRLSTPALLTPSLLALMPPHRVIFAIDAAALADSAAIQALGPLHQHGYRILLDGASPHGSVHAPSLRAISFDCAQGVPAPRTLAPLFGPHLARGVDTAERREACARAGFGWFCGDYPIHPAPCDEHDDGTSRRRLLKLLGLLAADADTREVEVLLKQDPALSYHLLKLVNSAAFAPSTRINGFSQAIGLLGRRQLQRWLQLLLYARQREDGLPNPLLPVAALRAAQMESLCKQRGGDREAQDLAFMVGVFSLLDILLGISMEEIADALHLAPDAAAALIARDGSMGSMLALVEAPSREALWKAGVTPSHWWHSQLHAYHWAIQVSRNL